MSDGAWVERGDVYSVLRDEWLERYIGYYKTPKGRVRDCGHRHSDAERAESCATLLYNKTLRESR